MGLLKLKVKDGQNMADLRPPAEPNRSIYITFVMDSSIVLEEPAEEGNQYKLRLHHIYKYGFIMYTQVRMTKLLVIYILVYTYFVIPTCVYIMKP